MPLVVDTGLNYVPHITRKRTALQDGTLTRADTSQISDDVLVDSARDQVAVMS